MRPGFPNRHSHRDARTPQVQTPPRQQAVMPGESRSEKFLPIVLVALAIGGALVNEHWHEIRQATKVAINVGQALRARLEALSAPEQQTEKSKADAHERDQAVPALNHAVTSGQILDRLAKAMPSLGPLQEVANISSEGMEVELGPEGQVLMTSKRSVQRLAAGDPNNRQVLFSMALYRAQFSDSRPQAMASALALPNERYLLGGWHGEVLLWADGKLQRLSSRDERPKGKIADLRVRGDEVLVAGDGLWRLAPDGQHLQEIPLPGLQRIRAMGQREGRLLLATDDKTIYELNGDRAAPWLTLPEGGGYVEMMVPARDGGWLIGTTRGLFRFSDNGQRLDNILTGIWTTSVIERPDELWVGTWKQGLLLYRHGQWHRLSAGVGGLDHNAVNGLVIDSADHFWLTLYGGGGWHAELGSLRERLMQNPWSPEADARK